MPQFTPTQQKIISLLSDGLAHRREEVCNCIDEYCDLSTLHFHISNIRKLLRPLGEEILCERRGWINYYRHVRLLSPANQE